MLRKGDEPIPGYRLEKFLGRGQYGEVWQASVPGRTKAALKFIDLSGKHGLKELRGITRVKEIRHAHLMPITALWMLDESGNILADETFESVDTVDGLEVTPDLKATVTITQSVRPHMLIVAMLLGKKSLLDRLEEAKSQGEVGIPPQELLVYLEEAAKGIDFLNKAQHDLGEGPVSIQHCDIKPANIMLLGDSVLICDFGLARMLGTNLQATATGMVGSPAYMAPECIRRKPSTATDQYSLAISYVELRTGQLPFHDETYAAVLQAHESGTLKLDDLPSAEAAVIKRATSVNPVDRFPSCQAMVESLKAAVACSAGEIGAPTGSARIAETLMPPGSEQTRETAVKRSTWREGEPTQTLANRPRNRFRVWPIAATLLVAATGGWIATQREAVWHWIHGGTTAPPPKTIPQAALPGVTSPAPTLPDFSAMVPEADKLLPEGDTQFTLLVRQANSRLETRDFDGCRATINQARKVASDDATRRQLVDLELQMELADSHVPLQDTLAKFAEIATQSTDQAVLCAALATRGETEPALAARALDAFSQVESSLPADSRSELQLSRQRLLRTFIVAATRHEPADAAKLREYCEEFRRVKTVDPIVNAVWIETKLRAALAGQEPSRGEWILLETTMQTAATAAAVEPHRSHADYVRFVQGLLQSRSALAKLRDTAADLVLAARQESAPLFDLPWRRQLAAQALIAAARRQSVPTDADLAEDPPKVPDEKTWQYLTVARQLEPMASPELIGSFVLMGISRPQLTATLRDELIELADPLLADDSPSRRGWLLANHWSAQLPLAAAELHAQRWRETQLHEDLVSAVGYFARALREVFDPRRANAKLTDARVYERVLVSALPLVGKATAATLSSDGSRRDAAELWGALGCLISRDVSVARDVVQRAKARGRERPADQIGYDAFRDAVALSPRAEFLVGQAWALTQLPDDGEQERLSELESLLKRALELDPKSAGAHNLQGYVQAMQSRREASRERALSLLHDAIKSYKTAIAGGADDDFLASYYEGLSAASLEAAFHSSTPEAKRPYLVAAVAAAEKALGFEIRRRPWEAYLKLGNAREDQAHYLYDATFGQALEAFSQAYQLAESRGSLTNSAQALLCLGRSRERFATSNEIASADIAAELTRAESELREAISLWEQLPRKREISDRIAQTHFFLSEVLITRAKRLETDPAARAVLFAAADQQGELGAKRAWEARSLIWPRCQNVCAKLGIELARQQRDEAARNSQIRIAAERAQAVLTEADRQTLGFPIPLDHVATALDILAFLTPDLPGRVKLIEQNLARLPDDGGNGTQLRFAIVVERARQVAVNPGSAQSWKEYESLCRRDAEWASKAAAKFETEESRRSSQAQVLDLLGRIADQNAERAATPQDRRERKAEAIRHYEDALAAFGDDAAASAETRLALAVGYVTQISRLPAAEKKPIAQRVLEVLQPIQDKHLPPSSWDVVRQYRVGMQAILDGSP